MLVMTHQILLNGLRQGYFKLDFIKVLIFDECHHARGNHPYACIMTVSYFSPLQSTSFIKFLFCCIIMIYLWFIITLVEVIFVFSGKSFWKSPPPVLWEMNPAQLEFQAFFCCPWCEDLCGFGRRNWQGCQIWEE